MQCATGCIILHMMVDWEKAAQEYKQSGDVAPHEYAYSEP